MTMAHKCDRCEKFYESIPKKTITLDVHIACDVDEANHETFDTWSDVDLCEVCSDEVLKIIAIALEGRDE